MTEYKCYSAPGKALLAGGYLVLDEAYDAYVVALSSRMHAIVSAHKTTNSKFTSISVKSPQFLHGTWLYHLPLDETSKYVPNSISGGRNPFVESTITNALAYVNPDSHYSIDITIFSDSGYHSQQNVTIKSSGSKTFSYHQKEITQVPKTGLGSSAGLVTVLTTAILSVYSKIDLNSKENLQKIHNLSQISHCQAQGKVGSGFDVAAATFGSIVYRRFNPQLINGIKPLNESTREDYHQQIFDLVANTDWNTKSDKVALPDGILLVMGDVETGSNTPNLVSKVLAWRKQDPESAQVYESLNRSNIALIESLSRLNKLSHEDPESFEQLRLFIHNHTSQEISHTDDAKLGTYRDLIQAISLIRSNLRLITQRSKAEIEPEEQTRLLDECLKVKGVISGVVPGAGGYDAISLLVEESSVAHLKEESRDNPILQKVSWLDLREEDDGIKEEDPKNYIEML